MRHDCCYEIIDIFDLEAYNKSMKKILFILFMICGLFFNIPARAQSGNIDTAILLSMMYITNNVQENGRFVYRNSTDENIRYSSKYYSSLRHAGTLYSMYLCEKELKYNSLKRKRILASDYFLKNYVQKLSNDKYVVVSKPVEEAPFLLATSGGAGLGLMALSNLYPEKLIDIEVLKGLGNFIIFMQAENGDFWASYDIKNKTYSNAHYARYYPGEAALGLLYLYDVNPDKKWLNASKKTLLRLAKKAEKKQPSEIKFDHWAMLASKKLYENPNNGLTQEEKSAIQEFVQKNVNAILPKQNMSLLSLNYGSFNGTRTLCGNATIMEGLIAAYDVVSDASLKTKIAKSAAAGTSFLMKYQVHSGKMEGGIPGTSNWKSKNSQKSDKEIRIDNVQHSLSAFINYKKITQN